ncbi:ORF6N domain-containing protein [Ureibacillus composti]|nr:ORF6N domain-containing protein [Ureibacillus composti]
MQQLQELQVIEHRNSRVLTTSQLAESLETEAKVINRNFQRNKDIYQQGVHYFALSGDDLKWFKATRQNDASLKFVSVLYLWTEQGAWMHAKSINNSKARKAMSALIDNYFSMSNQGNNSSQTLAISYEKFIQIERRVETLEQRLREEITLHSGEQLRLRKAVSTRIYEMTDNHEARQALFRSLYAALKERYHVSSYRDIKQHHLQDALRFITRWGGRT